jgi:hypothetical protein
MRKVVLFLLKEWPQDQGVMKWGSKNYMETDSQRIMNQLWTNNVSVLVERELGKNIWRPGSNPHFIKTEKNGNKFKYGCSNSTLYDSERHKVKDKRPHTTARIYIKIEDNSGLHVFSLFQIFQLCELVHCCYQVFNYVLKNGTSCMCSKSTSYKGNF